MLISTLFLTVLYVYSILLKQRHTKYFCLPKALMMELCLIWVYIFSQYHNSSSGSFFNIFFTVHADGMMMHIIPSMSIPAMILQLLLWSIFQHLIWSLKVSSKCAWLFGTYMMVISGGSLFNTIVPKAHVLWTKKCFL